jgi:hypothetical protein
VSVLVVAVEGRTARGFGEVPAFNRGRYAEHWFATTIG